MEAELAKPAGDRDVPLLRRLFRQTFHLRRNAVVTFADTNVQDIVQKYPLL